MRSHSTTLSALLSDLAASGPNGIHFKWTLEVITPNATIEAVTVLEHEVVADYEGHSDVRQITFQVYMADYTQHILPNENNLLVKVVRSIGSGIRGRDKVQGSVAYTYDGYLVESSDPSVGATGSSIGRMITISMQLVDRELPEYRLIKEGGVFYGMPIGDVLRGLMTQPLETLGNKVLGVDMVPADNAEPRYQSVIESDRPVMSLPEYIQSKYGLYNNAIGWYLDRGTWYVYPLYDRTRFDRTRRVLTIVDVPQDVAVGNDNSFFQKGDTLVIFTSGGAGHSNQQERILNNHGNGFRYSRASTLIDRFRDVSEGISEVPADRNLVERILIDRPKGLNQIRDVEGMFSDNPWSLASKISPGLGTIVNVKWASSDPYLLYPSMPVEYIYQQGSDVRIVRGCLLATSTLSTKQQKSIIDNRYVTSTSLKLFVDPLV